MHPLVPGATVLALLSTPVLHTSANNGAKAPFAARSVELLVRNHTAGVTSGNEPKDMVYFAGGTFTLGVSEKDLDKLRDVDPDSINSFNTITAIYPTYKVELEPYFLDRTEVTNIQYKTYLDATGLKPSPNLLEYCWYYWEKGELIKGSIPPGQENHPVRGLTFDEVEACAHWMGKRIPTEAEWEAAARYGLDEDQFFPWSQEGWEGWDPTKLANAQNSTQGSQGSMPFRVGSWEGDRTPTGLLDLCGNVAEWTDSPFSSYPGWEPLKIKVRRIKDPRPFSPPFNEKERVIRGGSYFGNKLSNNLVIRWGFSPGSVNESIGFRCAQSAAPGLDALIEAERNLSLLNSGIRGTIDRSPESMAGQTVLYKNPEMDVITGSAVFAFAHVEKINKAPSKFDGDSLNEPELVGIFHTSRDVVEPKLPKGAYAVYFRTSGKSDAYQAAAEKAEEEAKQKKAEKNDDEGKGKGKGKGKENGKAEDGKGEGEKPDEELTDEEKKAREEDARAQDELRRMGAVATQKSAVDILEIPTDIPVLLLKNESGDLVAWMPAKKDEVRLHPTMFRYVAGVGDSGESKAIARTGEPRSKSPIMAPGADDYIELQFSVRTAGSSRYPEFVMQLQFASGAYSPVEPPAQSEDQDGGKKGRQSR